jgi:hypothetical protein
MPIGDIALDGDAAAVGDGPDGQAGGQPDELRQRGDHHERADEGNRQEHQAEADRVGVTGDGADHRAPAFALGAGAGAALTAAVTDEATAATTTSPSVTAAPSAAVRRRSDSRVLSFSSDGTGSVTAAWTSDSLRSRYRSASV